jgi:hypothetical protein
MSGQGKRKISRDISASSSSTSTEPTPFVEPLSYAEQQRLDTQLAMSLQAQEIQEHKGSAKIGERVPIRANTVSTPTKTVHVSTSVGSQGEIIAPAPIDPLANAHVDRGANRAHYSQLLEREITDGQANVLAIFDEINGQDAYSVESAAIGRLHEHDYLWLPDDEQLPIVHPSMVGAAETPVLFNHHLLAKTYALNKAKAPQTVDAVKFALLRVEAVKKGWVAGQREIKLQTPPTDYLQTFIADLEGLADTIDKASRASFVIPLVAEHTFRTFGHHYISGDAQMYNQRYERTLKACLASDLVNYLPPPALYHAALHWVSPARGYEVLKALRDSPRLPEALKLRMNSAPAGCALVTTNAAVLTLMKTDGVYEEFKNASKFDLDGIVKLAEDIKVDPARYHKSSYAYNVTPLNQPEKDKLSLMRALSALVATYTKAYIEAVLPNTEMAQAKALDKAADSQPMKRKQAVTYFRRLSRKVIVSLNDLFDHEAPVGNHYGE